MSSDLLAPVVAGTRAAGLTSDSAWVRAMLECEAALARAQARLGLIPTTAAETITRVASTLTPDPATLALHSRTSATPVLPLLTTLRAALHEATTTPPPSGPPLGPAAGPPSPTAPDVRPPVGPTGDAPSPDVPDGTSGPSPGPASPGNPPAHLSGGDASSHLGADPSPASEAPGGAASPQLPGDAGSWGPDGLAAEFVHLGVTSQDIVDSAAMLVASRVVGVILEDLGTVMRTLAELADTHRATVMAARTLGQHAVPTTFGLKAAGWLAGLIRARDALTALRFPAQLGGAAGTLAAMTERGWDPLALSDLYAAELGLAAPAHPWHTERSVVSSLGAALAGTASALGKLATDVILLAQTEVGEVAESTEGASSAMPHKRNPALSILIRSASLQVPAYAQVLYAVGEHERSAGAWQASWLPLRDCLRLTGGATATAVELVAGLQIFPDKMRANAALTGPGLVSERLAVHPDADQDPRGYLGAASELIDRILGEL
ncbi:lyase family protein [Nonomuraea sediminis]|uniref:lyase family protein n=1 Tax=Nonomuraea sediminis TaxID=2835864 RepID=UPI00202A609A|nr:lyase family protein [Nonomuraea sediminis]